MQYRSLKAEWLHLTDELRNFGCFAREVDYKSYKFMVDISVKLSWTTLRSFFALAAYQMSTLCRTSLAAGEAKWAFPAASVLQDESGTTTRPWMLFPPLTLIKVVEHFVLTISLPTSVSRTVHDHRQLGLNFKVGSNN